MIFDTFLSSSFFTDLFLTMEEADVVRIVESSIAKKNESLLASMKSMLESSLTDLKRSQRD